MKDQIGEI